MTTNGMTCAELDERLSDHLEGELGATGRRSIEAHLASCARCTSLVRDLERIRADARALAPLPPARDLWEGIARRIEAPVVAITAPPLAPNVAPRRRWSERARLGAIAAALVAVTAGVTYTLTASRAGRPGPGVTDVAVTTRSSVTGGDTTLAPGRDASRDAATPAPPQLASADSATARGPGAAEQGRESRASAQEVRNAPAGVTYSREIDRLRTIFRQNRSQLDPRTAAIIEANLKIIDEAIAQSRAALAQDPASGFLTDQLNTALGKKLELLRTAALLPNRAT